MSTAQLSDIASIVQGGRKKLTGVDFVESGYPAFGAGGINGYLDEFEFDQSAVVLSSIGARCGKCFLAEGKWASLANTQLIFPDPKVVDTRFLWYQLNDENRWHRSGTAQPFIKPSDVKTHDVYIPPIEEQRRIASILDAADALRTKRRLVLAKLDTLTQAIFIDMFGDPVSNQRSWPTVQLAEFGDLDRGVSKHRPRNDPDLLGGKWPLIQTGDVANSGGYITAFTATYSDLGLAQSKIWPKGTLCITIAANIAKTGILMFDACFPDSVVGFTSQDHHRAEYVRAFMRFLQPMLELQAPESAQKNINLKVLRSLEIPMPPDEQVRIFSAKVSSAVELSRDVAAHASRLDCLLTSLQHRAFRGEL